VSSASRVLLPALWAGCLIPVMATLLAQDHKGTPACDHGTRGSSHRVDLDAVTGSLKRAEAALRFSMPNGAVGGDLDEKRGADLPACRSRRRTTIRLESPAPKAAVGTKLVFRSPDALQNERLPKRAAVVLVGSSSLSKIIRVSADLKGKADLGVYVASPELLKAFGVECHPAVVTFSSETDAVVEMGAR